MDQCERCLKSDVFQISPKNPHDIWATMVKKLVTKNFKNSLKIGHTVSEMSKLQRPVHKSRPKALKQLLFFRKLAIKSHWIASKIIAYLKYA